MKSGGPWNLRGLRPEARAAARDAARRSGMSVGEWLNTVIQPADAQDDETWWSADVEERPGDRSAQSTGQEFRDQEARRQTESPPRRCEREMDEPGRQRPHDDESVREQYPDRPPRHRNSEPDASQRHAGPGDDAHKRHRDRLRRFRHREADEPRLQATSKTDETHERYRDRPRRFRDWQSEQERPSSFRDDNREFRRHDDRPKGDRDRNLDDQLSLNLRRDSEEGRSRGGNWHWPAHEERPRADAQARAERQRRERELFERAAANTAAEQLRQASIDQAVAEITARQRALDDDRAAENMPSWEPKVETAPPLPSEPLPQAPQQALEPEMSQPTPPAAGAERAFAPWPDSWRSHGAPDAARGVPEAPVDISGLQEQLREMTARIEALRPSNELENAIAGLRADLTEISRTFTEALPRRALESLEIEVKALGQRIDHSRQAGVDSMALSGVEHGLAEVREALRGLTPAEGLVGFDDALKALTDKVDSIGAKNDPAALQQLEAAIGALRAMISRVASDDALTKVAEDVRVLSVKVDGLASGGPNAPTLAALENRIDILASALNASTEAGHAVPRELEKLLSGLIEKLEGVQLTHTDRAALGHLEDRIAALVKRLDASDARLGLLEGVERGLADLLVYIEQLRGTSNATKAAAAFEREAAVIKQTERVSQAPMHGPLEDMQARAVRVSARVSGVEPESRSERLATASILPKPLPAQAAAPAPQSTYEKFEEDLETDAAPADAIAAESTARPALMDSTAPRPTAVRTPIDPNLPPDHPLEPGSASRSRNSPPPAERIAAPEASLGSKPPVIPDPGGKPDFIAAARRAAQAASAGSAEGKRSTKSAAAQPKKLTDRLRTLAVAAAVVVIVVGGFHIISRLFEDGSGTPASTRVEPPRVPSAPQSQAEPPRTQGGSPQAQPEAVPPPRSEPPHVEAEPLPPVNAAKLPTPVPLPGHEASQNSAMELGMGQGAPTGATPAPRSQPNSPVSSSAPVLGQHDGKAESRGPEIAPPAVGAPTDITGSLPNASSASSAAAPRSAATAVTADKLPAAIGGPALRLAALAGDPLAAYEVGVRFFEGRGVPANNEEAARWFEVAAKKGIVPAQFRLGTLYEKGLGVKKDLIAARDFYRAAADRGHGKAMHNLAVIYAEGVDGKPDYNTAAQWFRKAADYGVTDSQYNLAILYARGVGVEQNLAESYKWFFLAAKEGDRDAARKRDEIASRLDRAALAAARAAAENWTAVPQPADAITVKGAWDPPANPPPAAKPKARSAKATGLQAARVN